MLASRAMDHVGNLVLIGAMGAGKSTLAVALGGLLSLPVRDLDHAIEAASGVSIGSLFERFGEAHFRAQEHAVLDALLTAVGEIIACGGGVVLAARNRELLAARAYVVWLDAPIALLERRLREDGSRPLLRSPDLGIRLTELSAQRDPLYAQVANLRFAVNDAPVIEQAARLVQLLPNHWTQAMQIV